MALADLQAALENVDAAILAVTADMAAGTAKPTYTVNGQSFAWTEYYRLLLEQRRGLVGLIADAGDEGLYEEPLFLEV